ncbi:hypothetical protein MMC18_003877 [Xylographa bjoerkii]|nr:hypothetical protein [Xylographa bjoerkii]
MGATEAYEALPEAERFVGAGRFGSVKKVKRVSDSKILACKSIRFQDAETSKTTVERECTILAQLDHPNVIKQVDVMWQPHKAKIYMEYCEGGSLQDLMNERIESKTPIREQYIWNILFQLASALLYCHLGLLVDNQGRVSSDRRNIAQWNPVLHRDIKPANVFLFSRSETALNCVRLGDFGLGYILQNDTAPETYAGTAQYLAPEINRTSSRTIHWTEHCDIFSLGCTIYALCNFAPPFDYHMETESEAYGPIPEHYSDQLRNCIASCLSYYPQTRPNALRLFQQSQQRVKSNNKEDVDLLRSGTIVRELASNTSMPHPSVTTPKKRRHRKKNKANQNLASLEESEDKSLPGVVLVVASPSCETQNLPNNVLLAAVSKGDVDLTRKALEMEGANPNATTADRRRIPVLSLATEGQHENVVKLLIDAGADVNQGSDDDTRALHRAAKHNRPAILQVLLDKGVSVDDTDKRGRTALCYAAEEGHTVATRILLSRRANPNAQDYEKRTPLHWATMKGHLAVVKLLIAAGASNALQDTNGLIAEAQVKKEDQYTAALELAKLSRVTLSPSQKRQKNADLVKFSQNFKLLAPVPKDLVPILSNDKSKQAEIVEKAERLSKEADAKAGKVAIHQPRTWVPDPGAKPFVHPTPTQRTQYAGEAPSIPRWHSPPNPVVRLPPSSGPDTITSGWVPQEPTIRQPLQNSNQAGFSNFTTQVLRPPPPAPAIYSYAHALRRGTINGRQ